MEEKLILEALEKALQSLQSALAQPKNEFTRDAAIQRFEYTFELCWKIIKRYMKTEAGIDEYNIKNLFREAGRAGLIDNVAQWFVYHKARNLTVHTYNEKTAEETFIVVKQFALDAEKLLSALEKHNDATTL